MSFEEKQNLKALRDNIPMECDDDDHFQSEDITLQDVLDGTIPLGMSHAGGEYDELRKALESEFSKRCVYVNDTSNNKPLNQNIRHTRHRVDHRTRRERVLKREIAFKIQIDAIADAFMSWNFEHQTRSHWVPPPASTDSDSEAAATVHVTIIDIFCKC